MVRKIQEVLNGKPNEIKPHGNVEFDELYLSCGEKGNLDLEREPRKRGLKLRGRGTMDEDKPPIIGACDRKGNLRLKVSEHADSNSICAFFLCIMASISDLFKVFTDDFTAYRFLDKTWIPHETVNHSKKEYARGEVHNNTIEGYWSVFRHWMNTYRGVSKIYLADYVSFFEFVENNKKAGWIPMFHKIIFFLWLKIRSTINYVLHNMLKNIKSQLINTNQMLIATVSFT